MDTGPFMYELHNYEADPQSGAGNCVHCNDAKNTHKHPHKFTKALGKTTCVCGSPERALPHQMERI